MALKFKFSCCIPNCPNKYFAGSSTNKHFFRPPPNKISEWNNAIRTVYSKFSFDKNSRLCEDHFSLKNFSSTFKTRLITSALPDFPELSHQNESSNKIDFENGGLKNTIAQNILDVPNLCSNDKSVPSTNSNIDTKSAIIINKKFGSLKKVITTCVSHSSKRGKILYDITKGQMQQLSELKSIIKKSKYKMKLAEKISQSKLFLQLQQSVSKNGIRFVSYYFRDFNKHRQCWTPEDKVLALALYKRGPRSYRFLSRFLRLPSRSVLDKVLSSFLFDTGINKQIFDKLKVRFSKVTTRDRFCCLMFDEISLSPMLHYDRVLNKVVGYVDLGSNLGRFREDANRALVFMISGLHKSWKQPVAYYFTKDKMKTTHRKILIREVIVALQKIGIRVICTVCDPNTTNAVAIKQLIDECHTDQSGPYFIVNKQKVVAIHDTPHLLKNTRNALKSYNIEYADNKVARWDHIVQCHEMDSCRKFKVLYKIDKEHLALKHPRLKMNVSIAAMTMSHRVAAALEIMSFFPTVPSSVIDTAEFIEDIDQLFDSLNSVSTVDSDCKELRQCVSRKTEHINFWYRSLEKIKEWKFLHPDTGLQVKSLRCKEGWITTIQGMIMVWDECRKAGFKYLRTRALNQDPIENLFSLIRQHSYTHPNPTPYQFISALKTCILNRLVTPRANNKNCEDDGLEILEDFKPN